MLKLYRRGRVWFVRGVAGPPDRRRGIHKSAGTADRALAEAYRAKLEQEAYEAAVYGERAVVSFAKAVRSFVETRPVSDGDKRRLDRLLGHFGTKLLAEIDQAAIDGAIAALCPDASPATKLRAVIAPASAVLNHAWRRKWCDKPAFERPSPGPARTDWLTPAQAEAMLAAAADHLRPLLLFLLGTGARVGEALVLPWADVDLTAGVATFRNTPDRRTKSGRDRTVHLPPTVIVALGNLPHRDGRVFRTQKGEPYRGESGQFKTAWAGAWRRAGLEGEHSPHSLRHTWATWYMAAKPNPLALMHAGGWSELSLVERYAHLAPSELVPQVARVWGVAHPDLFPAATRARAPAGEQKREAG